MLTLHNDRLCFTFPDVHSHARCVIEINRTLRIPDDEHTYPLPPKFNRFPLRPVDDYPHRVSESWLRRGGVFIPIYQSEALWIGINPMLSVRSLPNDDKSIRLPRFFYPCAIKIATGKINAVSGEPWKAELQADPQDYVVTPNQCWLDGYNVAKGLVRQFVATPLKSGFSVEEQITGRAEHGGLQIAVYPMKLEAYEAYYEQKIKRRQIRFGIDGGAKDMGLAAGGLIRQEIAVDPFGIDSWDQDNVSRCFIHLLNSHEYQAVTEEYPPHPPFRAEAYAKAGLPWFHYYSDDPSIEGAVPLSNVRSLADLTLEKTGIQMPENKPLGPLSVNIIGEKTIREGEF